MLLPSLHLLKLSPPCATDMHADGSSPLQGERNREELASLRAWMAARREGRASSRPKHELARRIRRRIVSDDDEPQELEEMDAEEELQFKDSLNHLTEDGDVDDYVGRKDTVKMLVLDFDLTMTIGKIRDANGKREPNPSSMNLELYKSMTKKQHIANFGGQKEVDGMKDLFSRIQAKNIEIRILSYGLKESIVIALEAVGLDVYFTDTRHDGAEEYEELGSRVYGQDVPPLTDKKSYKGSVISEWMEEFGLDDEQVAFLDDDQNNIDRPDLGEKRNMGVAQILEDKHAKRHKGKGFSFSRGWIEWVCGLART